MTHHTVRSVPARGSMAGNGNGKAHKSPRVAIGFKPEMFHLIASMAAERKAPFATIVRELCEKALRKREH